MASIDFKDALPTVKQEVDTRVTMHRCQWKLCAVQLGPCLWPGQRDGGYKDLAKLA